MKRQKANGLLDGLSNNEIDEQRLNIAPVDNSLLTVVDSDDEDARWDLLFRRRLFSKQVRSVAANRHTKGQMALEALERPGVGQLHVSDLMPMSPIKGPPQHPYLCPGQ